MTPALDAFCCGQTLIHSAISLLLFHMLLVILTRLVTLPSINFACCTILPLYSSTGIYKSRTISHIIADRKSNRSKAKLMMKSMEKPDLIVSANGGTEQGIGSSRHIPCLDFTRITSFQVISASCSPKTTHIPRLNWFCQCLPWLLQLCTGLQTYRAMLCELQATD